MLMSARHITNAHRNIMSDKVETKSYINNLLSDFRFTIESGKKSFIIRKLIKCVFNPTR